MPQNKRPSNYQVIRLKNGQYQARYMIQDGWETELYATKEEAIAACKSGAEICNGTKIKKKHISFGRIEQVVRDVYVWDILGKKRY